MTTLTIADIRARYPQYGEMSDNDLADALHQRFYAERPRGEVYRALGLDPAAAAPSPQPRPASIYSPPPAAPTVQPTPIDGDTVRTSQGSMRMTGIDAPESSQTGTRTGGEWPAGEWATDMLTRLMEANPSQPDFSGTDRYQRLLGTLMSGTTDLNRRMVGAGAALPYMGEQYSREAQAAEAARLGLWSGEFQAPSDYRHETGAAPMGSTAPIPRTPITYDAGMMERARGALRNLEAELASAAEQQRPEIEADIARVSEEIRALEARTMQPEYVEGVMRGVEDQQAATADPFAGEGIGALLQRRAQQFGMGANEMLASSLMGLDALQTAASLADTPTSAGTREAATGLQEERARTILEMQQRLADPALRDEERAILAQRIADMGVGQERLSGIAAGQQTVAGQQQPVDFRGAAEGLRARFAETFGTPPDDPSFWASLAQGAGSMSAFLGTALAGGALGGPAGAVIATGGIGAASNSGQVYEEALQAGANQDDALSAAGWGALVGSSEVIPIGRAFRFLPSGIRDRVAGTMFRRFGEIALNAGEEAAQEAASQVLNNLIAQGYYDPERGWSEGVTESALVGGILGAGTGALAQAMGSEIEAPVRAPREEPNPDDVRRGAELTGIQPYVPGEPRQVSDAAPVPAEPQAAAPAPAPLPPGRAAVAPPPAAAARARMGVSIGGQEPFLVEVLGEDPDGIRIREADGTESVLPRQDIEDGDIVISPIEEQAAPAATEAIASSGDVGQAAAPVQPQAQPVVGRDDQPAAGQPEAEPGSWVIRDRQTGEAIMETSNRAQIANLRTDRYEAVPIGEYLAQVNERAMVEGVARETDRRAELPKINPEYAPRNAQTPRQQFPELRYRQPLMAKIASQGGIAPTIQQNGATVPSWAASELAARGVTPQTHPRLFKPGGATDLDNIDPATLGTDAAQLLGTEGTGRYANREAIIEALAGEAAGTPFDVSYGAREARRMEQEARDRRARGLNETIDEGADGRRVMPPDADSSGNQRRINRIAKEVDRKLGEIGGSWTADERSAIVDRLNREGGSIDDAVHDQAVRSYQEAVTDENAADEPQSPEMGEVPFGDEPLAQRGEPVAGEPGDDRAAPGQPSEDDRQREGGRDEPGDSGAQPADRGVTERTAAGDQAVIPGAEVSDTQARQQVSDRQRAEIAARQQQSKMRRLGGNEGAAGPLFDTQGDLLDAPGARPAPSPKQRTTKAQREREAQLDRLAEYFAPGNIVRTYGGGHDRVISFDRGTNGEWTATVQAVSRKGDAWVDAPNERPRTHRTEPEARDMRAGPVLVAAPVTAAAQETDRDPIQAQAEAAPLYASRAVSNPVALIEWAKAQGFTNLLAADDLHVTTAFSRDPVAAPTSDSPVTVSDFGQPKRLGDEGAIVLPITGASARRLQEDWQKYRDAGASWDFPSYQPHITLTYDLGDVDLAQVEPFAGALTLAGETQAPLDLDKPARDTGQEAGKASRKAKIEDFGEKIGGARKDTAEKTGPRDGAAKKDSDTPGWRNRYEVTQIVKSTRASEEGKWRIGDKRAGRGGLGAGSRQLFDTKAEAEAAVPMLELSRNHRVYSERGAETFGIYRNVTDRKRVLIRGGFATNEAAMRYMAQNAVEIIETKTRVDDSIHPALDVAVRIGDERRARDRAVSEVDFQDVFGFRGVEFGNWNNNAERQHLMNQAFDAFLDLAEIIQVPPRAISLNGDLALAFGARGSGLSGARAHYERDYAVINLTKIKGAGSLAHEWWHAVDHYLGRQDGKASSEKMPGPRGGEVFRASKRENDYSVYGFQRRGSGVREEIRNAIQGIVDAMMWRKAEFTEDTSTRERIAERQTKMVDDKLKSIRAYLAAEQNWGKKRAPATAEQLARFEAAAKRIADKRYGEIVVAPTKAQFREFKFYEAVMEIANLHQEVRGRQAYGVSQNRKTGAAVDLQMAIETRDQAEALLADAASQRVKEKRVRTEYFSEAWKLDQGSAKDYWSTPHEMIARAFESYIYDRLGEVEARNDFLSFEKHNRRAEYMLFNAKPYPEGAERESMNEAFRRLFDALATRETDRGVQMFSRAAERYRRPSFSTDQLDLKRRAMGAALQQAWKRLGLPDEIRLRVVDRLLGTDADGNVVPVDGSYVMGLVQVALDSTEGSMSTMHHEAIHMLRDPALWGREYGLFSEKEWRALEAEAAASWMDKHNIRELYRDLDPISQIEEAIAAEFSEAWAAKHAPRTPVLARAFNQISRFLKALGNALRGAGFRDAQSVFDAILAGEVGARGQVRGGGQGAPQFSRAPATDSEAFKRWFGDSKVVDENGDPLVVYHGTSADFEAFDLAKAGGNTGDSDAEAGLFFSDSAEIAATYAAEADAGKPGAGPNVLAVYLSISKPLIQDWKGGLYDAEAFHSMIVEAREAGHDGAIINNVRDGFRLDDPEATTYVAFSPEQVKSAFNRGTFDPADARIRYSRRPLILRRQQTNPATGAPSAHTSVPETAIERIQRANAQFGPPAGFHQPPLPMSWTLPKRGLGMAVREAFQDQFLYLRAAQAEIEAATGQPLTDRLNASQRQSLFPARVAERLERLFQGEVKDFFDAMKRASKQAGISREDLWVYMVAKHAPERNAVMQKRDPQRFAAGGGSGIHDSAAHALLADLQAQGKVPALEALAKRLRKMLDDDLLLRRNAGLISDQQYQSWRGMYQNYVPLRGFAERDDGEQIGRLGNGFDMRGKEVRSALGRTSIADDPISQIITMRQEGIVRAEKNRVAKTLMNLVQAYPAPGLWEVVGKLPMIKRLDPDTGLVVEHPDQTFINPDKALAVKVGGQKVFLRIEDAYLLDALNRLGGDDPRKLMERIARSLQVSVGAITRMVAATSTALNPNFTVPNLQSDLIEGIWTAHNVDKKGMAAAYAKAYMPALTEAFRDEFGDAVGWMQQRIMRRQNVSQAQQRRMQQYIEEWKLDGGKINFVALRDMDDVARDIDRMTRRAGRSSPGVKAKARAAGDAMAAAGEALIAAISKLNQPIESASRLAMYVAAREQGLSREKAAALAQDATTNYYRRGAATPTLRAAYAFINPAIQSLEKLGRFAKRPRNWAVAFPAVIVLGALQTLLGALVGGDDDDPEGVLLYERLSQYDRHRNIIIPTGTVTEIVTLEDGSTEERQRLTTVNWRMAYPLRPFLALGSELMLAAMGRRTPEEVIANVSSASMMSWNPLADGQWANMVTPTVLDPLVDMRLNRNFMDSPIVPDDRYGAAEGLPRSSQFFERSNTRGAVEIAQFLNRVSGGDAYTPGRIDLYPGHLDYVYRFVTGGTGIFAQQVVGAALDLATGTPTERRNIPIARAFSSETSSFPEQTLYYDLRGELTEMRNRARQAWTDLQADPENAAARDVWDEISGEMNVGVRRNGQLDWRQSIMRPLDLADGALRDLRAELTAVVNGDLPRAERTRRAEEIRLQIEAVQRRARAASVQQRAANIAAMHPPVP